MSLLLHDDGIPSGGRPVAVLLSDLEWTINPWCQSINYRFRRARDDKVFNQHLMETESFRLLQEILEQEYQDMCKLDQPLPRPPLPPPATATATATKQMSTANKAKPEDNDMEIEYKYGHQQQKIQTSQGTTHLQLQTHHADMRDAKVCVLSIAIVCVLISCVCCVCFRWCQWWFNFRFGCNGWCCY